MPKLSEGLIVAYGDDALMADQIAFRDYSTEGLWYGCGVAAMSPAMLGKLAWVRTTGPWLGPCVVADVVAQHHYYRAVYLLGEVVEVPDRVRLALGFKNGAEGLAWFGPCPPPDDWTAPRPYQPAVRYATAGEKRPVFWPQPAQQPPQKCSPPPYN